MTAPNHHRDVESGGRPEVVVDATVRMDRAASARLAATAERFARTLVAWLYGDRRELDVEPSGTELRRQLAAAPPYVPPDQLGTGDGRAARVEVYPQTRRSGVLVISIVDARASYRIPASFELRAGRWRVVRLNTH